jgi:MFS family permease
MLGKLIKHEFKATWKLLTILFAVMGGMTLVGILGSFIMAPLFDSRNTSEAMEITAGLAVAAYFMIYGLTIFLLSAGTYVYLGIRFYHSMYGKEGYLTNTLPTTPFELITAKMLTAVTWVTASIVLLTGSIFTLIGSIALASGETINWREFRAGMREAGAAMREIGLSPGGITIYYALFIIIAIFFSVLMMYGSAALGQLVKKHRILASIGIYFIMSMVISIVSSIISVFASLIVIRQNDSMSYMNLGWNINFFSIITLLITLAGAVGLFFLTHHITSKNLNLE